MTCQWKMPLQSVIFAQAFQESSFYRNSIQQKGITYKDTLQQVNFT